MKNLAKVLQALKELNFMLANRAPELAAHYNILLEPEQTSTEEVSNFVKAYFHQPAAYSMEQSSRGRPHFRDNQHHWYNRQSSPLLRYRHHANRSDMHLYSHKHRNYNNTNYHDSNGHNTTTSARNMYNTGNMQ